MSDKQEVYFTNGNAGLNLEFTPDDLKQWDIFGKKKKINQPQENNKIWVVVNTDQTRVIEFDMNEIPIGHTKFSWYSKKNSITPLGHTDFSIGKKL